MICLRKCLHTSRCRISLAQPLPTRRYSTRYKETVSVPCHSNGSITLDVYNPSTTSKQRDGAPAVVLYLPPGLSRPDQQADEQMFDHLRSTLGLPLVKINYRLGLGHRFPTPLHDVLAGYDWVLENLLPKRSPTRAGRSESVGRVGVYGEYVGGGLATALALTECRVGQPGIVTAAVSNPIVDWLALDERPKRQVPFKSNSGQSESGAVVSLSFLLRLRSQVFAKPSHYFDPFASPLLFFRSAGTEAPSPSAVDMQHRLEDLSISEYDMSFRNASYPSPVGEDVDSRTDDALPPVKRKTSQRFPGKNMGLRLPSFHISADEGTTLTSQAIELELHLRASFIRQSKNTMSSLYGFGRKVLEDGEENEYTAAEKSAIREGRLDAKRNVRLDLYNGSQGLQPSAETKIENVVSWMNGDQNTDI